MSNVEPCPHISWKNGAMPSSVYAEMTELNFIKLIGHRPSSNNDATCSHCAPFWHADAPLGNHSPCC
eukprot:1635684-Karenia_brevis.AAC.1